MSTKNVVLCLVLGVTLVSAIFREQTENDWHRSQLGSVQHAIMAPSLKNKIILASHHVVAAVRAKTGAIVWKQVLEDEDVIDTLVAHEKSTDVVATASNGCSIVRLWSSSRGQLVWESDSFSSASVRSSLELQEVDQGQEALSRLSTPLRVRKAGLHSRSTPCSLSFVPGSRAEDAHLVLVSPTKVAFIERRDGATRWTFEIPKKLRAVGVARVGVEKVFIVVRSANRASSYKMLVVSLAKGKKVSLGKAVTASAAAGIVQLGESFSAVWFASGALRSVDVNTGETQKVRLPDVAGGKATVSIRDGNDGIVEVTAEKGNSVLVRVGDMSVVPGSEGNFFTHAKCGAYWARVELTKGSLAWSAGTLSEGPWTAVALGATHGFMERGGVAKVFCRARKASATKSSDFYVLVVGEDHSITMYQGERRRWERDEGLASIVEAGFVDLPPPALFSEDTGFSIGGRLVVQAKALKDSIAHLGAFVRELLAVVGAGDMIRAKKLMRGDDAGNFGFDKILLALTAGRSLYALSSLDGSVKWQLHLPSHAEHIDTACPFNDYRILSRQHSHTYILATPSDQDSTKKSSCLPLLYNLDAKTGHINSVVSLQYQVQQVLSLPFKTSEHVNAFAFVSPRDKQVYLHPDSPHVRSQMADHLDAMHFYQVKIGYNSSAVQGFKVTKSANGKGWTALNTWTMAFDATVEQISGTATLDRGQFIQSAVRKIGQTSHRKYLNPNTIAVATVRGSSGARVVPSVRRTTDPSVTLYVLDTVSGAVLHKVVHKQASGPVHVVMSENKVVYHYFSLKAQQYELSVMELHATEDLDDILGKSNTLSSFDGVRPFKKQQTYVLGTSITALATTQTRKGITSKNFLFGLSSNQLLRLPEGLIDSHRPYLFNADAAEKKKAQEAGLVAYTMDLPSEPAFIQSYDRAIHSIRGIVSHPTELESTALVLVWGIDMFFTRVVPTTGFDVLSDEFNTPLLALTVVGVAVLLLIMRTLAYRKGLDEAWH